MVDINRQGWINTFLFSCSVGYCFLSSWVWMLFIWQALKVDYARNTHVIFWHHLIHTKPKEKVFLLAVHNITITKSNTFWCPWYHLMEMENVEKKYFLILKNDDSCLNQKTITRCILGKHWCLFTYTL